MACLLFRWVSESNSIVAKHARLCIGCLAARRCLARPALHWVDQHQGAAATRKGAIDRCVDAGLEDCAVLNPYDDESQPFDPVQLMSIFADSVSSWVLGCTQMYTFQVGQRYSQLDHSTTCANLIEPCIKKICTL